MGVLLGTVTLLLGIVSRNYEGYEVVVPKVRAATAGTGGVRRKPTGSCTGDT